MLKDNEFVLLKDGNEVLCKAVAAIYSNDSSRGFVVYDDGTKKDNTVFLKVGEIVQDDEDILVEEVLDKDTIMQVWNEFQKLCKSHE